MDNGDVARPFTCGDLHLEALLKKTPPVWQRKMRRVLQIWEATGQLPNGGHKEVGSFVTSVWALMRKSGGRLSEEQWAVLRRAKFPTSSPTANRGNGQNDPGRVALREQARKGALSPANRTMLYEEMRCGRCSKATVAALQEGGYLDRFEQMTEKFYARQRPQAGRA